MKVALVLNGDEPGPDEWKLLPACDAIVCADGAAQAMLRGDHRPTVIVGDMDSLAPETYKWAEALDIPMERYPERKDATDGELCLEKAVQLGAKSVLIMGGHGGRSAMVLANLKILRRAHDLGMEASMVGKGESIRYITPGGQLSLAGRAGATLNLLAVDGDAVVSLKGTSFDGDEVVLARKSARGVSNKIVSDGASVTVRSGTVLCIVERKKQAIMMV